MKPPSITNTAQASPQVTATRCLASLGVALALGAGSLCAQTVTDYGTADPTAASDDVYQLTYGAENPGLNYYYDNSAPPGQTFTTGSNPYGYVLTSLYVRTAGGGNIPSGGVALVLRLYSVADTNATLLTTYTCQSGFTFTESDWLQFTNLGFSLAANSQYAYSVRRTGSGWERMANVSGNPYAGGEAVLIPTGGGAMSLSTSRAYDATFLVSLTPITALTANPPALVPSAAIAVGSFVTNTVAVSGPTPYYIQWQTDGGTGGAFTNIPGGTGASLVIDTTGYPFGPYQYRVIVTNSTSSVTSDTNVLRVVAPVVPATLADLGATATPISTDLTQFVGGGNQDGINYYDDNGINNDGWPGQTFKTGTNSQGYYLTSISLATGGGGNSDVGTAKGYNLLLYKVDGSNAVQIAHYTNASFTYTFGDWLKWSGFNQVLQPNTTYAYAHGRGTGTGWAALSCSPNDTDLYADGQICLIPGAGGTMAFGTNGLSDAVFDIGLTPIGVGPSPLAYAGTITLAPARAVAAGTTLTLSQAATGQSPLYFQWRTDGGSGTLTNIPGATGTNLVVNTTGWRPTAYKFDFIVQNSFGSSTAAVATVAIYYTNGAAILTDIGSATPTPVAGDIAQTTLPSGVNKPDGLNYYFDNGSPPGQTFVTDSRGSVLTSLAIKMAGGNGNLPSAGQYYILRLYTVSGNTATLYATYTSQSSFVYTSSDWLRWSGFALPLPSNTTLAYTFARNPSGAGWENLGNVSGNPFANGEVALIDPNNGAVAYGSSHSYDGTFIIGLATAGYPYVSPITVSPAGSPYAGSPITLSTTVLGNGPFTYQWRTDGGNTGVMTNIPNSNVAAFVADTTGLDGMSVTYDVVVSNGSGSTTSEPTTVAVQGASYPLLVTDVSPASQIAFVGATVTFAGSFIGTQPIDYRWQFDPGTSPAYLPGQTNGTLVLTNLQVANSGVYTLYASNILGTANSAAALLNVVPVPAAPFTVNYQWHSTEGGDGGNYAGTGVPGLGTGTFWNQIAGPSAWTVGTFFSTTAWADDGSTESGMSWTITNGGSWAWTATPNNALLNSGASAYGVQGFKFSLPNGRYNIALFSCNGTEASTTNGGTVFKIQGQSQTALPTQNSSFILGDTYVVFSDVVVKNATLLGTWEPATGKSYGSLNGAQLRYLGPAVTLDIQRLTSGQIRLEWSAGTLLEAISLSGPWTTNSAASPLTLSPSEAQKFYRVIVR